MSEPIAGTDWQPEELDAIVADYFDMLATDLAGVPYVKTGHRERLILRLGRSNGSIEFKYQNISAVLDKLGSPWIPGYKPAKNYQGALFDAIDRYLETHPAALDTPIVEPISLPIPDDVFVPAPNAAADDVQIPRSLQRLVRKYDPVERDARNRKLGKAGEAFVFELEQRRLHAANRADLARKMRWVADEDGDGAGYDVLSFDPGGSERLLEVKTTNGSARTPFFLSRNECAVAAERPQEWRLYRVHLFASDPRVFTLAPPLDSALKLTTETWRASF
jgi:hypothetical protein